MQPLLCPRCCDPCCSGADCILTDASSGWSWAVVLTLLAGLLLIAALAPREPLLPPPAPQGRP